MLPMKVLQLTKLPMSLRVLFIACLQCTTGKCILSFDYLLVSSVKRTTSLPFSNTSSLLVSSPRFHCLVFQRMYLSIRLPIGSNLRVHPGLLHNHFYCIKRIRGIYICPNLDLLPPTKFGHCSSKLNIIL